MKRLLIALAAGTVLAGAVYGAAASLGGTTGNTSLGAEAVVISSCDTDGVNVFTGTGASGSPQKFRVRFVRITGIHDNCLSKGAQMFLTGPGGSNIFPGPNSWFGPVQITAPFPPAANNNEAFFNIESFFTGPPVKDLEGIELQIGD